jgi:hypothetical protein
MMIEVISKYRVVWRAIAEIDVWQDVPHSRHLPNGNPDLHVIEDRDIQTAYFMPYAPPSASARGD